MISLLASTAKIDAGPKQHQTMSHVGRIIYGKLPSTPSVGMLVMHWKILYVLRSSKGVPKDNILLYQL